MKLFQFYSNWQSHDGKIVLIDNIKHKIEVRIFEQTYPYKAQVISVHAVPLSKNSQYYKTIKLQLGDDFSTDILDSDIKVQSDVLRQLEVA
jgi:hypothetical protein